MKRYIRSSRKDDLLKEKAAWQMKYDARKQLYKDQEQNYHNARWDWIDNLVNIVTNQFKAYIDKLPGLIITADRSWGNVEIHFNYEDRSPRENKSLLWSYEIQLTESGEIKKESNSWSGFQAVTSTQIDDLMNSANLLKAIVEFDWAPVLEEAKKTQPKYSNYIGIRDPNYDPDYKDPGYDKMIKEAEVDEAINSGKWIKAYEGPWNNGSVWYFVFSQTPKFYDVAKFALTNLRWALTHEGPSSEQLLEEVRNPQTISKYSRDRIKKANLNLANPIETKTGEELIQLAQQSMTE